ASASRILAFSPATRGGSDRSSSSLNGGIPSRSKISRLASGGRSSRAARKAARLNDALRRLPGIPRMRTLPFPRNPPSQAIAFTRAWGRASVYEMPGTQQAIRQIVRGWDPRALTQLRRSRSTRSVYGVRAHRVRPPGPPALLLGYGNLSNTAIVEGVKSLASGRLWLLSV